MRLPVALWITPLCPAGHLPHKGGDRQAAGTLPMERAGPASDLPPCGGDARQGRGGYPKHRGIFQCAAVTASTSSSASAANHRGHNGNRSLQALAHDGAAKQRHRVKQRQRARRPGHGDKKRRRDDAQLLAGAFRHIAQLGLDGFHVPVRHLFEVCCNGGEDLVDFFRLALQPGKGSGREASIACEQEAGKVRQLTELGDAALRKLQALGQAGIFHRPFQCTGNELFRRKLFAQPAAVQPIQLLDIEDGAGLGERFRVELRGELVHGQKLFAFGDLDEEQAEEVHQRFRQVAERGVIRDRGRVLPLGKLGLVGVAHQRKMHEHRLLPAEITVKQDVLGHGRQPFFAARHMGDLHQMVVDDVGHVIGRHAVGLDQHLHVDGIPRDRHIAINTVMEIARAFGRDFHAHDVGFTGGNAGGHFFGLQVEAVAVIFRRLAGGALGFTHLLQPLGRAETAEGMAFFEQLFGIGPVHGFAFGLAIRAVRAANIRAFRPGKAGPAQGFQHLLLIFEGRAGGVGILDAQDELAAVFLGEEIVEQRDIGGADMRLAGGGRCNADANAGSGHEIHSSWTWQ
ncbi:hypothetical protein AT6N2_C1503 [Agrobacterium tumefaciens]|nr:hypothetical protein AT6N2_C1503 [Agrobacterium tumefaciens]